MVFLLTIGEMELAGYFLIVAGVVTGIHTVAICGAPSTIPVGLIAIIHLFVGSMFVAPRKGALEEKIALTVVLPLWFLALVRYKIMVDFVVLL